MSIVIDGYIQENDLIYCKFPAGNFLINGSSTFFKSVSQHSNDNEIIISKDDVDKIFMKVEVKELSGYQNIDTKENLSVSEYTKKKHELLSKSYDQVSSTWDNIADRHAYELLIELNKPQYVIKTTLEKVIINLIGEDIKNHQFIIPIRKVTGDLTNTLYRYNTQQHLAEMIRQILTAAGYNEQKTNLTTVSYVESAKRTFCLTDDLKYSKIVGTDSNNSGYVETLMPALKKYMKMPLIVGTYDDCLKKFDDNNSNIKLELEFFVTKPVDITKISNTKAIMNNLQSIVNSLNNVAVFKNSQRDFDTVMNKFNNVILEFKQAVIKADEDRIIDEKKEWLDTFSTNLQDKGN